MLGLLIGFVAIAIDILQSYLTFASIEFTPYGFLIFIFLQAHSLSSRSARAFSTVEKMTSELQQKNIKLKETLSQLTVTERLRMEVETARTVQKCLIPQQNPELQEIDQF